MDNKEPQGGGTAVATPEAGTPPTNEAPQATPTTETQPGVVQEAGEVAANAEQQGGSLPESGMQPPAIENPSSTTASEPTTPETQAAGAETPTSLASEAKPLNPASPLSTPDTASLNATHQQRQEQKKGSKLNPLNWGLFNKTYEKNPDTTAPQTGQAAPQSGMGMMPGQAAPSEVSLPPQLETTPPPPVSGSFSTGPDGKTTTSPVPGVSPEAQAAASAPAPEPATTGETQGTTQGAGDTAGVEAPSVAPTGSASEQTENSTSSGSAPDTETHAGPTVEAPTAEAPATPGLESPAEPKTDEPDTSAAIHPIDEKRAANGGAEDDAKSAEALASAQNAAAHSLDVDAPEIPKFGDKPLEGTGEEAKEEAKAEPTAKEFDASNAENASIENGLPEAQKEEDKISTGDGSLPIETNPPVHAEKNPDDQWMRKPDGSNPTGENSPIDSSASSEPATSPASTPSIPSSEVSSPAASTPATTENETPAASAPVAESPSSTTSETPTAPEPTMEADKAAVEKPVEPTPTVTQTAETSASPEPDNTSATETTVSENVTTAMPGVTPQQQTGEQIATSQGGTGPTGVVSESQPQIGQPIDANAGAGTSEQPAGIGGTQTTNESDESNQGGNSGTGTPPAQAA